jgi:5-methylcytosine-specific restriction endonuclease McrA
MTTTQDRHSKSNGQGQGMNWIRKEKRLAIYLRDGLACCYCGQGVEDGAKLTLDHLTPHSQDVNNLPANLVTACHLCNSRRGARDWQEFAEAVAGYLNHNITGREIITHIQNTIQRPLDVKAAQALIARRGGFTQALQN